MRCNAFARLLFLGAPLIVVVAGALGLNCAQAAPPAAAPPPAALQWRAALQRAAHSQWGLDAPVAMLAAQVHQESGWNPRAVSRVGAAGMAQFMPATARWWCAASGTALADCLPENPTWALRAMVGYDRWLFDRLPEAAAGANPQAARLWATLRAYNGGLANWQAEARRASSPARADVDAACGSARRALVHCAESLGYPQRILLGLQPRYAGWGRTVAFNE